MSCGVARVDLPAVWETLRRQDEERAQAEAEESRRQKEEETQGKQEEGGSGPGKQRDGKDAQKGSDDESDEDKEEEEEQQPKLFKGGEVTVPLCDAEGPLTGDVRTLLSLSYGLLLAADGHTGMCRMACRRRSRCGSRTGRRR